MFVKSEIKLFFFGLNLGWQDFRVVSNLYEKLYSKRSFFATNQNIKDHFFKYVKLVIVSMTLQNCNTNTETIKILKR